MKPTIGRIVHFVMPGGKHRPAIVTDYDCHSGVVSLSVFVGRGEQPQYADGAPNDETDRKPGSWHWPEREEKADA